MKFTPLALPGAYRVEPEQLGDERGFFARLFCTKEFATFGLPTSWSQCNMSFSANCGMIRGLHFQRPPNAETKLVRCTRGAVFDVIVDLRSGSPSYGNWHAERLDDRNNVMICIPAGCAHGFQTLTNNAEMLYFHSAPYSAQDEGGLRWDDPALGIIWPFEVGEISARDRAFPSLRELEPIKI